MADLFQSKNQQQGATLTTLNHLTRTETIAVFGLENPRAARIRKLSPRQILASQAASRAAREQGLRIGMIVEFEGDNFVVVAAYLTRIGLQHMVDLSRYRNPPVVYWNESEQAFVPMVSVVYMPRPGFIHVQSFRDNHASILNARNRSLMEAIIERLSPDERYQNEHGEFWLLDAVKRVLGQMDQEAEARAAQRVSPEPVATPQTFCAKCGNSFIDDDPWRRSKRCQTCRIGDANMGKEARHCIGCSTLFEPYQNGAKLWKCALCTVRH